MFKKKDQEQKEEEAPSIRNNMKVQDFMPGWSKEEDCFKDAFVTDINTGKKTDKTWPRLKPTEQLVYETWLNKTINENTGEWYPQRDQNGNAIKNTGGRYVVSLICRIKKGKEEFLLSKGFLKGYDAGGSEVRKWIIYPEKWVKTNFNWKRIINDKTMTFDTQCEGPSNTEEVYDLPFNASNVDKLWNLSDKENVSFIVKKHETGDALDVNWSSLEQSYQLFKEKSFEYLWLGEYIPPPVKSEMRARAEAEGLIRPSSYNNNNRSKEGIDKNQGYLK